MARPPQRIHDKGAQHLPSEEAWLVGEHRSNGEHKYYCQTCPPTHLSKRSPQPSRRAGSASRRIRNSRKNSIMGGTAQALSHVHDRSRLPSSPAARTAQRGKKNPQTTASTKPPSRTAGNPRHTHQAAPKAIPALPQNHPSRKSSKVVPGHRFQHDGEHQLHQPKVQNPLFWR